MKKHGVVVRFGARGYGFIHEAGTAKEYFVHISDVCDGLALQAGQRVEFEEHPLSKPNKLRSALVRIIEAAPVSSGVRSLKATNNLLLTALDSGVRHESH